MEGVNESLKLIAQTIDLLKVYDDDNARKAIQLLRDTIDKLAGK